MHGHHTDLPWPQGDGEHTHNTTAHMQHPKQEVQGKVTAPATQPGRTCMTMVCMSFSHTSWKFLTLASLTRPLKLRHQHRSCSFQWGALFTMVMLLLLAPSLWVAITSPSSSSLTTRSRNSLHRAWLSLWPARRAFDHLGGCFQI